MSLQAEAETLRDLADYRDNHKPLTWSAIFGKEGKYRKPEVHKRSDGGRNGPDRVTRNNPR